MLLVINGSPNKAAEVKKKRAFEELDTNYAPFLRMPVNENLKKTKLDNGMIYDFNNTTSSCSTSSCSTNTHYYENNSSPFSDSMNNSMNSEQPDFSLNSFSGANNNNNGYSMNNFGSNDENSMSSCNYLTNTNMSESTGMFGNNVPNVFSSPVFNRTPTHALNLNNINNNLNNSPSVHNSPNLHASNNSNNSPFGSPFRPRATTSLSLNNNNNNSEDQENIAVSRKRIFNVEDSHERESIFSPKKVKPSSSPMKVPSSSSLAPSLFNDWVIHFLPPNMVDRYRQARPEDQVFNEYEVRLVLNKAIESTKRDVQKDFAKVEEELMGEQFANFTSTREVINPSRKSDFSYIM